MVVAERIDESAGLIGEIASQLGSATMIRIEPQRLIDGLARFGMLAELDAALSEQIEVFRRRRAERNRSFQRGRSCRTTSSPRTH